MPPVNQNEPTDFRPAGAAAGAALPLTSLLQYYLHELPTYRKQINSAVDIDKLVGEGRDPQKIIRELVSRIKPGDVGVAGLQPANDAITRFLVNMSAATAGGPGAHGQIYGSPMVDSLNRPIQFFRNPETGALFEASSGDIYGGGESRAIQEQAAKLEKARRNAQALLEEQVQKITGKSAPTDPKEFKKFVTQLARTNKDKGLRGAYNALARASNSARQHSWDMIDFGNTALQRGFTEKVTIPTVHHGGWSPAVHNVIRDTIKESPQNVSKELRRLVRDLGPDATGVMGPTLRPFGAAMDTASLTGDIISGGPQAIYNRAHEIPRSFMDALKHDAEKTDIILRARGSDKWHQKAHNLMDDIAEGVFQKNDRPLLIMRPQMPKGVTPEQYQQALDKMLPHMQGPYAFGSANAAGAANVFLPKVNLGGKKAPNYFELASKVGPEKAVQQMCSGSNAHHCGSMPATVLQRLGQRASGIWSKLYLPNFLALEKGMSPVAVVGKSRMLSDLARMSKYRGAMGLGAAAITGGLGYLGAGAAQNAMRGPAQPPKPQLDPAMFSKAMKLLQPRAPMTNMR